MTLTVIELGVLMVAGLAVALFLSPVWLRMVDAYLDWVEDWWERRGWRR